MTVSRITTKIHSFYNFIKMTVSNQTIEKATRQQAYFFVLHVNKSKLLQKLCFECVVKTSTVRCPCMTVIITFRNTDAFKDIWHNCYRLHQQKGKPVKRHCSQKHQYRFTKRSSQKAYQLGCIGMNGLNVTEECRQSLCVRAMQLACTHPYNMRTGGVSVSCFVFPPLYMPSVPKLRDGFSAQAHIRCCVNICSCLFCMEAPTHFLFDSLRSC